MSLPSPEMITAWAVMLTAIGTLFASLWQSYKAREEAGAARAEAAHSQAETQALLTGIKRQVTNDHPANLRDDLDEVKAQGAEVLRRLGVLEGELREERRRVTRTVEGAERTHTEIFNRLRALEWPRLRGGRGK